MNLACKIMLFLNYGKPKYFDFIIQFIYKINCVKVKYDQLIMSDWKTFDCILFFCV